MIQNRNQEIIMNKILSIIFFVAIICSASHSYSGAITDSEFSAATLASLNDISASSKGSVPVGTVIVWPVANDPEDMTNSDGTVNWLECNGQTFNTTTYSSLANIVGTKTPNYQGMFLRGNGSQDYAQNNGTSVGVTNTTYASGSIGQIQGDSTRNISGVVGAYNGTVSPFWTTGGASDAITATGAFYWTRTVGAGRETDDVNIYYAYSNNTGPIGIDTSRITPTSTENRPVNVAVRYLIRALP